MLMGLDLIVGHVRGGKVRRHAAWGREVLIVESDVAVCGKRLGELEGLILKESSVAELNNLERVR